MTPQFFYCPPNEDIGSSRYKFQCPVIGSSLSEPHTSELNDAIFIYIEELLYSRVFTLEGLREGGSRTILRGSA